MDIDRARKLAGLLVEAAGPKNPHTKKLEGERKVADTNDYVVFYNRDVDEYRGVLKYNSTDDGCFEDSLEDCLDTLKATVKRQQKKTVSESIGTKKLPTHAESPEQFRTMISRMFRRTNFKIDRHMVSTAIENHQKIASIQYNNETRLIDYIGHDGENLRGRPARTIGQYKMN